MKINKRAHKQTVHSKRKVSCGEKLHYLIEEAERVSQELEEINEKVEIYAVSRLGYLKNGPVNHDLLANYAADKEALERLLLKNMHKIVKERIRIEQIIGSLSDEESRLILRLRLIDGLSWEEIGEIVHADRTTVSRKYQTLVKRYNM